MRSTTQEAGQKVTEKIAECLVKTGIAYADYKQNPKAYRGGIEKEIRDGNLSLVLDLIERQAPKA